MEFLVFFKTTISAKSKKDLERKAINTANAFSDKIRKTVEPHSAVKLKQEKVVQSTLTGDIDE